MTRTTILLGVDSAVVVEKRATRRLDQVMAVSRGRQQRVPQWADPEARPRRSQDLLLIRHHLFCLFLIDIQSKTILWYHPSTFRTPQP